MSKEKLEQAVEETSKDAPVMLKMENLENSPSEQALKDIQEALKLNDDELADPNEGMSKDSPLANDGQYQISEEQMKMLQEYARRRKITMVRKNEKINRNDPCPCGSGKKYKKCCLEKGTYEGLTEKQKNM